MDLTNVGEVIATRRLHLLDDETREIFVLIGKPRQFPDSSDYYCPFQVTGIGSGKVKYAGGVDAIQAIQLAMGMIAAELDALNNANRGRLRWEGDERGGLGFPLPR